MTARWPAIFMWDEICFFIPMPTSVTLFFTSNLYVYEHTPCYIFLMTPYVDTTFMIWESVILGREWTLEIFLFLCRQLQI